MRRGGDPVAAEGEQAMTLGVRSPAEAAADADQTACLGAPGQPAGAATSLLAPAGVAGAKIADRRPAGAKAPGGHSADGQFAAGQPSGFLMTLAPGWRWLAAGMAAAGIGLLPWMAYLAISLPPSTEAWHWPAAWIGLDVMEAAGLLATGILLLRRDVRCCLTALPTAGVLLSDAWFDCATAPPGGGELASVGMAIVAELPTAALCAIIGLMGLRRLLARCRPVQQSPGVHWAATVRGGNETAADRAGRLRAVRVLVVGSGGREHALARSLAADAAVTDLHAAPGNPGIAELAELHAVMATDPAAVTALAMKVAADLVVIGPEAPLVAGVADALRAAGISCFGPGREAAMIEGSKSFAKDVMTAAGVPTARARTCHGSSEVEAALDEFGPPYVVKADGLAAGKGVVVTPDRALAVRHAQACGTVVIEEFLDGPEVSVFALADGTTAVPLLPAQDYKRARDGDTGPNTGGMGAYAPLPWAPADLAAETIAAVIAPTLAELRRRATPFSGLLYAGLCLTKDGLRVVEFNARFGDPETQVVLDRLVTPIAGLLRAAADQDLAAAPGLQWAEGAAVAVVVAAEGYPDAPVSGDLVAGLAAAGRVPGAYVLQAGTTADGAGKLAASGGRVLDVVGTGPDLARARSAAYEAAAEVKMRGGWYRSDIAASPAAASAADR
jgi:phosphoribosylamine---glycine ligase